MAAAPIWTLETGKGAWEYGGTQDGTPPLSQRVEMAAEIDGVRALSGGKVMRVQVHSGDQYGGSTGERTLVRQCQPLDPCMRLPGYRSAFVMPFYVKAEYPGVTPEGDRADVWVFPFEFHHNTGKGTAPLNMRLYSDGLRLIVKSGRDDANKVEHDKTYLPAYARNGWHVLVLDYEHAFVPDGYVALWHGRPGDADLRKLVELDGIGTMYTNAAKNYALVGGYRPNEGASPMKTYLDATGFSEWTLTSDALDYGRKLIGASGPDPGPGPDPDPDCSEQEAKIAALEAELADAQNDLDECQAALARVRADLASCGTELADCRDELLALEAEMASAVTKLDTHLAKVVAAKRVSGTWKKPPGSYKEDNPKEAPAVFAYVKDGGTAPSTSTDLGAGLVGLRQTRDALAD